MNVADVIAALDMPPSARVDQRVPKRLFVENGASTVAERRKISEGIDEVFWLAALKPTTIGVPELRDDTREYLEIAVLRAEVRATAQTIRIAERIHRAVPYPVLLIATRGDALTISLAHKRRSQGEEGATVLDGALVIADPAAAASEDVGAAFISAIALVRQPRADLFALYQGWMDTVVALLASQLTSTFTVASSPAMAAARRSAIAECARLDARIAKLRIAAGREKQVARNVELNLEIKRAQAEYSTARAKL
jgi:hypothetical protein